MAGKVLILRWPASAYDSLGGLLELVAQEFAALGVNVTIFAAEGTDWPERLVQTLEQGGIAFALTMSGIATDIARGSKLIWEITKVPLFNWSCDHPCYFPVRHGIRSQYLLHGYVFPDHARYSIQHLSPNGAAFAVPLGFPSRSIFNRPATRNGRIMFTKSGGDTNKIEATWHNYGPDLCQIIFKGAEELFNRSTADFLPTLQCLAEQHGIFLDGDSRLTLLLIQEIDAYIRYKRANLVMQTIRRFPVDVFGTGWDHISFDAARARFHGPIAWRAMVDQLPNYLGCLSTNPLIEESAHDRIFFALAAGVCPISDGNAFITAKMPGLEPYCFTFTRERIELAIEAVLANPADAIARTNDTYFALATPFGLRRSALQIAQFAMLFAMNARASA